MHSFPAVKFGEAATGFETIRLIKNELWDLLILDINLPGKDGLEILHDIQKINPKLKALVFSMYSEDQYAVRSIKAGAYGYLAKTANDTQVLEAVDTITHGRKYISPEVAQLLSNELVQGHEGPPHQSLSDRELQTFVRIASGKTVTKVAEELNLSVSTVNTYRNRVLKKLNATSNADLIRYAIDYELI